MQREAFPSAIENEESTPLSEETTEQSVEAFREQYRQEHLAGNDKNGDHAWQVLLTPEEKNEYHRLLNTVQAQLRTGDLHRIKVKDLERLDELSVLRGYQPTWKAEHQQRLDRQRLKQAAQADKLRTQGMLAKLRAHLTLRKNES